MRIFVTWLVLMFAAVAAQAQLPLTGAGKGTAGVVCVPFTYPGGQVYQSLGITDSWSPTGVANTANSALSPDCTVDAAAETEDSSTGSHFLFKSVTTSITAGSHVSTVFVRQGSGSRNFYLQFQDSTFSKTARIIIALAGCTINSSFATGTGWVDVSQTAVLQANGYCKIVFTTTLVVDTQINFSLGMADASFALSYAGDGTSSLLLWGLDFR